MEAEEDFLPVKNVELEQRRGSVHSDFDGCGTNKAEIG